MTSLHLEKNWVIFTQVLFTFNSGFINLLTFHSCYQLPSSHVTGLITRLGTELYSLNLELSTIVFINGFMYFLGTVGTGYFLKIEDFVLTNSHYYAVLLQIFLLIFIQIYHYNCLLVLFFSTLVMGIQNGVSSSLSNHTLRSTHFTGMITDMGMCLGQALNNNFEHFYKFKIWISSLSFYFLGSVIASLCIQFISDYIYFVNIGILSIVLIFWKSI